MKIYLIGYMGCGKSSIGKVLAEKLHWNFFDTDEIIEKRYEESISDIFRLYGESEFRGAEQEVLKSVSKEESGVVSVGGGAPCFFDNMGLINDTGVSFYIRFTSHFLSERLLSTNLDKRPILSRLKKEDFEKFVEENILKREPYYLRAHHIVTGSDEDIINQIIDKIQ